MDSRIRTWVPRPCDQQEGQHRAGICAPRCQLSSSVFDHCLRSRNYVNVVVAGKHALPQWLSMDAAVIHCTEGLGIWQWASNDQGSEPDVVMACCGDTPTLEILAAVSILRQHLPELKIRVINVVDLMRLQSASEHPHGLTDQVQLTLHQRQAHHLWVPWIPLAGPPAYLSPDQPQPPCQGLQGRGDNHNCLRYAGAERPRPLPSCAASWIACRDWEVRATT